MNDDFDTIDNDLQTLNRPSHQDELKNLNYLKKNSIVKGFSRIKNYSNLFLRAIKSNKIIIKFCLDLISIHNFRRGINHIKSGDVRFIFTIIHNLFSQ